MPAGDEAKARGNDALKAGKYNDAVKCYTEAIEADPTVHVYYSNRANTYLRLANANKKLGDSVTEHATNALTDALKVIELKLDFVKGHTHHVDSLCLLGRYAGAAAAAKDGLEACPGEAKLMERVAHVEKVVRESSLGFKLWGDAAKQKRLMNLPLRMIVVGMALVYLFPFSNYTTQCYRQVMIMSLCNIVWHLLSTYGRPRLNKDYAGYLIKDRLSHTMFLCALCMNSRPLVFALIPVCGADFCDVARFFHQLTGIGGGFHRRYIAPMLECPGYARFSDAQRKWWFDHRFVTLASHVEVAIGLMMIVEMATPLRNVMTTIFFWQYLRVRYMIDDQSQHAFKNLNGVLTAALPGPIGSVYAKIAGFLHTMGKLPDPGEKPSMMSSCAVM